MTTSDVRVTDHDKPAPPARATPAQRDSRRWWALAVIGLAQLMVVLDATIVNIALPSAQRDLGFANDSRQWVITTYALAFGSLLLLGGRVSDMFGRRRAFLTGVVGFAAASALGGFAPNLVVLLVARAAQGVFGALLAPAALSLLSTTFTDRAERAKAFGIFGALAGAGSAVGLLLGGALTSYVSWRWCLLVNVPIAAVALVGGIVLVSAQSERKRPSLDLPGIGTAVLGLSGIVYGLGRSETDGFSDPVAIACLAVGVALLAAFVWIESRSRQPLMPLRVVLDRARGGAYAAVLLAGIGIFGVFLFLAYYLQGSLGYSPVRSGVAFLPIIVSLVVVAQPGTIFLLPRFGPRPLIPTGMVFIAGGLVWFSQLGLDSSYVGGVLPGLVLTGIGMGLVIPLGIQTATTAVEASDSGVASALVNTSQQVGGALGVALLSTWATRSSAGFVSHHAGDGTDRKLLAAQAAVHSFGAAFALGAAIMLAGAVITALILPPGQLATSEPAEPALAH